MTNTINNTNTNITNNDRNHSVQMDRFVEMANYCDAWQARTIAMLAELRVFFKYEELLIAKRHLDNGELISYAHGRTQYLCETSLEEIMKVRQLALVKSVRQIVDLNNLYKVAFGHPFMRKIKKADDDFRFDFHDTVEFFMDFEEAFNAHYNPENIEGLDLCDIRWNIGMIK